MSEIDIIFTVAAGIVIAVSLLARSWRPVLWVAVIAISYVISDFAWRSSLGTVEAAALTAFGDAGVCLMFYFFWKERWEMMIWRLYQVSCAISIYYVASHLGIVWKLSHNGYSVMLETINALALLGMFGTSLTRMIGTTHGHAVSSDRGIHRLMVALSHRRTAVPFTHRAR